MTSNLRQIVLRLKGGLGNQLFQYSSARALADDYNCELVIDATTGYLNDRYGRQCVVQDFQIPVPLLTPEKALRYRATHRTQAFVRCAAEVFSMRALGRYFVPRLLRSSSSVMYLDCYLQSFRYFERYRESLLKELRPRIPLPPEKAKLQEYLQATQSVSLHVRLGHGLAVTNSTVSRLYRARATQLQTKMRRYYLNALEQLRAEVGEAVICLFSDGSPDSEAFANELGKHVRVVADPTSPPWEDFWLMSSCRYAITANSTYSWWAAWLSRARLVYAPAAFAPVPRRIVTSHVYPSGWSVL